MQRAAAGIDLECIRHNIRTLYGGLAEGSSLMAVVKADGYGHGAVPVAKACLDAGAAALGVATAHESRQLREGGVAAPILVMGPLTGDEASAAARDSAGIVLWSLPFLRQLIDIGHGRDRPIPVHVKIDTGMRRLGLFPRELPEMLDAVENAPELELAGVMTHFANADEQDDDFFRFQLRSFEDAVQVVLRTGESPVFHCANSAATMRYPESHFDMVRCGIAIYGLSPFKGDAVEEGLRPALRLTSYISGIKRLMGGDTVGYGRTWQAPRNTNIALIPIGYGDGVSRGLSSHGEVLVGGRRRPIVGRISMDLLTVDLGPVTDASTGDEVVLIGSQGEGTVSAEEVAGLLDTINYEVTCDISSRVERRYEG